MEGKVAYTLFSSIFTLVKAEHCHIPPHPSLKSRSEYQINLEYHVSEFDREQPLNQKYA